MFSPNPPSMLARALGSRQQYSKGPVLSGAPSALSSTVRNAKPSQRLSYTISEDMTDETSCAKMRLRALQSRSSLAECKVLPQKRPLEEKSPIPLKRPRHQTRHGHKNADKADSLIRPTKPTRRRQRFSVLAFDLQKVAKQLQNDPGFQIRDRRWHLKLYYHCFAGRDLTSWILQNFNDMKGREDAVALGNKLMTEGLFEPVHRSQPFKDGNYFYTITADYRIPRWKLR